MASARSVSARLGIVALTMLMIPMPTMGAIDPETYMPCSTTVAVNIPAGCTGAVGGGPSPTLLCWPDHPKELFLNWLNNVPKPFAPPPSPHAGGFARGCEYMPFPAEPDCPGGSASPPAGLYWPSCKPIKLPTQLMDHTAFWDEEHDSAYILGGSTGPGTGATSTITRFRRGMEIEPFPPVSPHAPGGTINPLEFPQPVSLPMGGTCQALAWDPVGRAAYLFGGWNGQPSDEIVAFYPDSNSVATMGATLPVNLSCAAGAWNPTVTPNCPRGCAYIFGGRYPLPVETGSPPPNPPEPPELDDQNPWGCGGTTDRMFLYDPVSDTVREVPWKLPWTLYGMTALTVGSEIYLFGGVHVDDSIAYDAQQGGYNPDVWACDPLAYYNLPVNTGLPAPRGNCDIYRFSILEGGTITRVNPYLKPTDTPVAGPAWGAGMTGGRPAYGPYSAIAAQGWNFCAGMRPGAIFDGRWIFIQQGANFYKLDPFTPRPDPTAVPPVSGDWSLPGFSFPGTACSTTTLSNCYFQMPFISPTTVKSPIGLRNLGFSDNAAVFTGCSAYWFGGMISPIVPQPNGPLSDTIAWFGKCRPKAVLEVKEPQACVGWPVRFDGIQSRPGEADIYWVEWNFGDGSPVVGAHWQPIWDLDPLNTPAYVPPFSSYVEHKYTQPGGYYATMTITDLSGFRETSPAQLIKVKNDPSCKAYPGTDPTVGAGARPTPAEPGGPETDSDNDGVPDLNDNCPGTANHDQQDINRDSIGDLCQEGEELSAAFVDPDAPLAAKLPDVDHDGIADSVDNCLTAANNNQANVDGDLAGDACDEDMDGDTIPNDGPAGSFFDNCPRFANVDQADTDGNGVGDACTLEEDKAPTRSVAPVQGKADEGEPGTPWTTTLMMVILAGLVTAAVLTLVLRRGLRKE